MSKSSAPLARYRDYNVLDKWSTPSWNDATRRVVDARLNHAPRRRFFDADEWRTLEAICARLIPQPDRPDDPVPIAPWIDETIFDRSDEGYRYHDLPDLPDAWRRGLRGLEQDSERLFGRGFCDLGEADQDALLSRVQAGDVQGDAWSGMNVRRFFSSVLLKTVVGVYYAHPAAWSEIGFGGPASPRGYVRLGMGQSDPWEAKEQPAEEGA